MTSEIFGVIGIELSKESFKSSIAPELSDFALIDKLIIVLVELNTVIFELFHTLKADTVILVTAGELINLKSSFLLRFRTFALLEENKRHILFDCFFHRKMISGDIHRSSHIGIVKQLIILFFC